MDVLVGSVRSINSSAEYIAICHECKNTVYLRDSWKDKKFDKIICVECFRDIKEKSRIIIDKRVVKTYNDEMGTNFTKKNLEKLALEIKKKPKTIAM